MSGPVTIRKALTRLALILGGILAVIFLVGIVASLTDDAREIPDPDPVATTRSASPSVEPTTRTTPKTPSPTGALGDGLKANPTHTAQNQVTRHPKPSRTPTHTAAPAEVYYDNCTAVRAAGAAPLYRGQPGYASHLDRDGDGVACET